MDGEYSARGTFEKNLLPRRQKKFKVEGYSFPPGSWGAGDLHGGKITSSGNFGNQVGIEAQGSRPLTPPKGLAPKGRPH